MGPCKRVKFRALTGLALGLALLLTAPVSSALSVRQFGIESILNNSAIVAEGRVTNIEVTRHPTSPSILRTYVTMELLDVIKGGSQPRSITFSILGGKIDNYTFGVAGYRMPALGESGVYFLIDPAVNYAQPFYGWGQGRFQIAKNENGAGYVTTYSGKPVYGLRSGGEVGDKLVISKGIAAGVRTKALKSSEAPMSVQAFKRALRGMLASQEVR